MRQISIFRTSVFVPLLAVIACAAGSNDDDTPARIAALFAEDSGSVPVGDATRLNADFTFAHESVFDEDKNVIIEIRIPEGVGVEDGSVAVDGHFNDDDVSATIYPCEDGGSLVVVNLDGQDLRNADEPKGGDARLKLNVFGLRPGSEIIEAQAGYNLVVSDCEANFLSQDSTSITFVPE